jgi:hypothetical protein
LIVSGDAAARAGVDLGRFGRHEIEVRGRSTAMTIFAVPNAQDLVPILAPNREATPA